MKHVLTNRERELASYLVDANKAALNRISPNCVSPLIAIRQTIKHSAGDVGVTALRSMDPITNEEWHIITRWIADAYFPA